MLEELEKVFSQEEKTEAMIREGDSVRVIPHEVSPPTQKYASQKGCVTMTSPGTYGPQLFVQLDNNPDVSIRPSRKATLKRSHRWKTKLHS